MPYIAVLPASTKAGAATIQSLLKTDPELKVRGIYRDPSKAPEAFRSHANFEAVEGDGSNATSLDFTGSDAVFYNQPPLHDGSNITEFLNAAAVKKLVILSAVGSQHENGIGPLRINHMSDEILKDAVQDVTIIRAGYFTEDLSHNFESVKADPPVVVSQFVPADFKVPIVSLQDVGEQSAKALLAPLGNSPSPRFLRIFGPRLYSPNDIQSAVQSVTGIHAQLVMPVEGAVIDFFAQQYPRHIAEELAEMTEASLEGGKLTPDYIYDANTLVGSVDLVDALRLKYNTEA